MEKYFDDQAQFYEVLERALHNYLKAKLKIETTELSKSKIKNLLHQNSVDKKTALEYVEVIESCEPSWLIANRTTKTLSGIRVSFQRKFG